MNNFMQCYKNQKLFRKRKDNVHKTISIFFHLLSGSPLLRKDLFRSKLFLPPPRLFSLPAVSVRPLPFPYFVVFPGRLLYIDEALSF